MDAFCDQILFGDADTEITGIACAWMASWNNLKKAEGWGCNVFITHEPLYAGDTNSEGIYIGGEMSENGIKPTINPIMLEEDDAWVKKTEWLKSHNLVVMRCHDVWDDFPEIGIHGAWAKWLGFEDPPVSSQKFYEVHKVDNLTLQQVAENIAAKVKNLGQECVHFIGDPDQAVTRIALGTGAITSYRVTVHMGADCLLLTDDGTRLWESGQWAEDTGIGLIVVNHATSEEPGVRALAQYLQEQFSDIPVSMIERGNLYHTAQ